MVGQPPEDVEGMQDLLRLALERLPELGVDAYSVALNQDGLGHSFVGFDCPLPIHGQERGHAIYTMDHLDYWVDHLMNEGYDPTRV